MNVHVSYKVQKTPDIEKELNHQIEKMRKRLQVFKPELVHLKAILEQNSPREGTLVSLNLRLPSGQLAAQQKAASPTCGHQDGIRRPDAAGQPSQGTAALQPQVAALARRAAGVARTWRSV